MFNSKENKINSNGGVFLDNKFIRSEMLLGKNNINKLRDCKIAVFGIGGVGSFVTEGLVRSSILNIDIYDFDKITESNINRQIIATEKTIGKYKVDVMKERILEINSQATVNAFKMFFDAESDIDFSKYDYVVDAIDTVTSKLLIVKKCHELNVPVISSMGTGNKLDPTRFKIVDIKKTSVCPLAKVMRYELKRLNIDKLKVLYSDELPIKPDSLLEDDSEKRRKTPGSVSFVPPVAGLIIAGEVIKDICGI